MPYNSLATVNPGDVLSSSAWGNQAKANEDYLFSGRPGQTVKRDNGANYTTTSTSFVDIDSTNLAITATINSGKVLLTFTGMATISSTAGIEFDFSIDGTRYASAGLDGLVGFTTSSGNISINVSVSAIVSGLSIGSHTFKIQWRVTSSTGTLYAGANSSGTDWIPTLSVEEIG